MILSASPRRFACYTAAHMRRQVVLALSVAALAAGCARAAGARARAPRRHRAARRNRNHRGARPAACDARQPAAAARAVRPPSWTRRSNPPARCSTSGSSAPIDPYRLVRSFDGLLREFEYQIDSDRFLRIVARDDALPADPRRRGRAVRKAQLGRRHPRPHRRRSFVGHRRDERGRRVRSARDDDRGDLRRPD